MRVLIVTYHFPPDAEIGGVRPYRLARHWSETGIEAWVLTVRPKFAESLDPQLEHVGVAEERVVRTEVEPTLRDLVLSGWRGLDRRRSRPEDASPSPSGATGSPGRPRGPRSAGREWVLSWLAFPDLRIGWYRPAVRAGNRLLGSVAFDAIVSTSPPRVSHLVAARLSRRHRIPWVMDFRDPWDMGWWFKQGATPTVQRALLRWMFRRTARHADAIVANTARLLQDIQASLPARASISACVPNGFVVETPPASLEAPPQPSFTIGYFGQVTGRRTALPFLQGLRLWLDRSRVPSEKVRVRFVGLGFGAEQHLARTLDLEPAVTFEPPVPRQTALRMMHEPWVLLLLATGQPLQVPGKAYEYLATGRRVLALTEREGATAELLDGVSGTAVAGAPEEIAASLDAFWNEHQKGAPASYDRAAVVEAGSYSRRAADFARVLEDVVRVRGRRG